MLVFVLTKSFPFTTGLNGAKESMNKDLDFNEKNKWKFIKSQIVLLSRGGEGGEGSIPGIKSFNFFFPAGIDCITYFTLFNINFASWQIQKLKMALLSWAKNEW